jgi:hypothetical protein
MRQLNLLFASLLISLFFGFGGKSEYRAAQPVQEINLLAKIDPLPVVQDMLDHVSQERILADVRLLSGVDPMCKPGGCTYLTGRFTGSEDLQLAKDYIYGTLVNLNYSVEVINWSDSGLADQDILAHKQGMLYPNEEIYFIAHMDGYPSDGPAADDDATGTVALLELARILANMHISRSVTLFFSTGEEQGSVGSQYFVNHYPERLAKIKYLVSVEMLGYDSNDDGWMELWSGDQNTEFQQMLSDIITAYPASINLTPQILTNCA